MWEEPGDGAERCGTVNFLPTWQIRTHGPRRPAHLPRSRIAGRDLWDQLVRGVRCFIIIIVTIIFLPVIFGGPFCVVFDPVSLFCSACVFSFFAEITVAFIDGRFVHCRRREGGDACGWGESV